AGRAILQAPPLRLCGLPKRIAREASIGIMSRNRAWETTGAIITDLIRWPGTTSARTGSSVRGWGARLPAADGRPGVRPVPRLVEPPHRGEDLRVVSEFPPGLLRQVWL